MEISYQNEVYRKFIHISSLWMVLVVYFFSKAQSIGIFALLLLGMMAFEGFRRYWPLFRQLTSKYMGHILRQHEVQGGQDSLTGAFYVILAVLISVIFFSKMIAMTSITIMILADTSAALIGRKYGKIKILDKSFEGSLSFFITATIILSIAKHFGLGLDWYEVLAVSLGVTGIELFSKCVKIDDNLSIVVGAGLLSTFFIHL